MVLTAHIALAAAVSSISHFSWPTAFLFGFLSHHFLDFIPHFDAGSFWSKEKRKAGVAPLSVRFFVSLDILAVLGFFGWLIWIERMDWLVLFWASSGAVLPDFLVTVFPFLFPHLRNLSFLQRYEKFHQIFFRPGAMPKNWIFGNLSTILIISFSLFSVLLNRGQ